MMNPYRFHNSSRTNGCDSFLQHHLYHGVATDMDPSVADRLFQIGPVTNQMSSCYPPHKRGTQFDACFRWLRTPSYDSCLASLDILNARFPFLEQESSLCNVRGFISPILGEGIAPRQVSMWCLFRVTCFCS